MSRFGRFRGIESCALVLSACTLESEPQPDFELETDRVTIQGFGYAREDLCGGTPDWIDGVVDHLAPTFGLEEGQIGRYAWHAGEVADLPCNHTSACADPGVVHATIIPFEHELVHLVYFAVERNSCVFMLSEGLADHFSGSWPLDTTPPSADDVPHMLDVTFEGAGFGYSDYRAARHFVAYLIETYGLPSIVELCFDTPRGTSRADFDAIARDQLGRDLDGLLSDYAGYPLCPDVQSRGRSFECARTPDATLGKGQDVSLPLEASCASLDAIGPRGDAFHLSISIRIAEDGNYAWWLGFPPGVEPVSLVGTRMTLAECAPCSAAPFVSEVEWQDDFIALPVPLRAGDYVLDLRMPLEIDTALTLRVVGMP